MNETDVVVVGGGVIGMSIMRAFKDTGLHAICVDPEIKLDGSASLAAGAMLGAFGEVTADKTSELDQRELEFRVCAADVYPEWLASLEEAAGQQVGSGCGTFVISNPNGARDALNLRAIARSLETAQRRFEWVSASAIPNYQPVPSLTANDALFLPDEGYVNTQELMDALRRAIEADCHMTILADRVVSVTVQDGQITGVETVANGHIKAERVVLAAGAGISALVADSPQLAAVLPPLLRGKGVSIVLDAWTDFDYVIRTPNRDFACGTHVVPRGNQQVYVGATNRIMDTPGVEDGVSAGEVHGLLSSAIAEINTGFRVTNTVQFRFGSRPVTPDRYPVVGETKIGGLFAATGTYRNGVLMAPLVGEVIKDKILGRRNDLTAGFAPTDRDATKLDVSESIYVAIRDGARDLVSFIQEPGGGLPYNRAQELQDFIQTLMYMLFLDDTTYVTLRSDSLRLLARYPISEIIPQLFYRYHAVARASNAS